MKRLLYLAVCALVVCSCSKETVIDTVDDGAMVFNASHPSSRATDTAFEQGDTMGVFVTKYDENDEATELQVSGNHGNNAPYTLSGSTWSSLKPIYWEEGKFDVYAYYPYMEVSSADENPFSVALDQSTEATDDALSGYEASDFLWASTTAVEQTEITALQFSHRLTKVCIHIEKGDDYEGDLPENGEVFIHNTVAQATIDLVSGYVTKNPYASTETIKAKQVSSTLYEAIVIPQRVDNNIPLFEYVVSGISYLVESTFVFSISTQHNIYFTIDNPNQIKIEIGGTVSDGWN